MSRYIDGRWMRVAAGTALLVATFSPLAPAQVAANDPTRDLPAGQASFEAVSAVVARLVADPATDWSRVDVEALRRHLADMDRVFVDAHVETEPLPLGARFRVTGSGAAVGSIQRMATAHSRALAGSAEFRATVESTDEGVVVEVVAADGSSSTAAKIRGLGFGGLLTVDDHHARHHWMLASGSAPPGH